MTVSSTTISVQLASNGRSWNVLVRRGLLEGHSLPQGRLSLLPTQILCQWELYNLFTSILMTPLKKSCLLFKCAHGWCELTGCQILSSLSFQRIVWHWNVLGIPDSAPGQISEVGLLRTPQAYFEQTVLSLNTKIALELAGLQRLLCWVQRLGFNLWNLASVNIPKAGIELSNF